MNTTHRTAFAIWIAVATLLPTAAKALDPETYVRADIAAREATIAGMRTRVVLLGSLQNRKQEASLSVRVQDEVTQAFAKFNTTSAAHAAYGTRHRAAIEQWLKANPAWQTQYSRVNAEFLQVEAQLNAMAPRP